VCGLRTGSIVAHHVPGTHIYTLTSMHAHTYTHIPSHPCAHTPTPTNTLLPPPHTHTIHTHHTPRSTGWPAVGVAEALVAAPLCVVPPLHRSQTLWRPGPFLDSHAWEHLQTEALSPLPLARCLCHPVCVHACVQVCVCFARAWERLQAEALTLLPLARCLCHPVCVCVCVRAPVCMCVCVFVRVSHALGGAFRPRHLHRCP